MAGQQRIVVPFTGHVIGEGFNSETVERVGTGLVVGATGNDPQAPGQAAVFKFQMLTSQSSLEKALNIGAELDARYALFSAGGKFSFAENSAVNTTSTYILASCMITNALRFGSDFTPNAAAKPLIASGDFVGFKRAFGDRFTQALRTGGEFHAVVRVTSSNVEHQRRISASLHAEMNGLTTSFSFKGSLETAEKDTSSHTEVDIQVHQTGGVGQQVQIPGTDADRIRDHMNRFATAAHANAAAYEAELLTYDTLALPFPPPEELEDRRRALEDCLDRRQRYWSVISDLTFAQSEDAPKFFENLPSPETLVTLQNTFRSILNDLMSHARKVSNGSIPPEIFVAKNEPPLPRFKRRTTGSFASWWTRAKTNDPTLLKDERSLIDRIAGAAAPMLTVPIDQATAETMERAADLIEHLDLTSDPPIRSIAALPKMIDARLRTLSGSHTDLEDLTGLEDFTRLESFFNGFGRLRNIQALSSAAGLRELALWGNDIVDLGLVRALTALEELHVQGNSIASLEPIRGLKNLGILCIASEDFTEAIGESPPTGFMDNPITDASALADLPRLSNSLVSANRLKLKVFDEEGKPSQTGTATRIGKSNRFQFVPDGGGQADQLLVTGLREFDDLFAVPSPIVVVVVRFQNGGSGIACTKVGDQSAFMSIEEITELLFGGSDLTFDIGALALQVSVVTGFPPVTLEVTPA
jgi:hypothetical protein